MTNTTHSASASANMSAPQTSSTSTSSSAKFSPNITYYISREGDTVQSSIHIREPESHPPTVPQATRPSPAPCNHSRPRSSSTVSSSSQHHHHHHHHHSSSSRSSSSSNTSHSHTSNEAIATNIILWDPPTAPSVITAGSEDDELTNYDPTHFQVQPSEIDPATLAMLQRRQRNNNLFGSSPGAKLVANRDSTTLYRTCPSDDKGSGYVEFGYFEYPKTESGSGSDPGAMTKTCIDVSQLGEVTDPAGNKTVATLLRVQEREHSRASAPVMPMVLCPLRQGRKVVIMCAGIEVHASTDERGDPIVTSDRVREYVRGEKCKKRKRGGISVFVEEALIADASAYDPNYSDVSDLEDEVDEVDYLEQARKRAANAESQARQLREYARARHEAANAAKAKEQSRIQVQPQPTQAHHLDYPQKSSSSSSSSSSSRPKKPEMLPCKCHNDKYCKAARPAGSPPSSLSSKNSRSSSEKKSVRFEDLSIRDCEHHRPASRHASSRGEVESKGKAKARIHVCKLCHEECHGHCPARVRRRAERYHLGLSHRDSPTARGTKHENRHRRGFEPDGSRTVKPASTNPLKIIFSSQAREDLRREVRNNSRKN